MFLGSPVLGRRASARREQFRRREHLEEFCAGQAPGDPVRGEHTRRIERGVTGPVLERIHQHAVGIEDRRGRRSVAQGHEQQEPDGHQRRGRGQDASGAFAGGGVRVGFTFRAAVRGLRRPRLLRLRGLRSFELLAASDPLDQGQRFVRDRQLFGRALPFVGLEMLERVRSPTGQREELDQRVVGFLPRGVSPQPLPRDPEGFRDLARAPELCQSRSAGLAVTS